MYRTMIRLETMDDILYNAQRQGRVSFYMTNSGEEAIQIGSAAAMKDTDEIFAQYREAGVLMYRGFTLDEFMNQCFSTEKDYGKGRQMPVHYGSKSLRFQTISSPLGTQIPQAAGAGYVLKLQNRKDMCVCYFGEGAASEGDFHAALNFASTLKTQTLFICRNNGYAISTPSSEQYKGDGIVARGLAYGMHSIRIDGNDLFASVLASIKAREMITEQSLPVLIEAMTYRGGHHSTSDDASRYRSAEELSYWRNRQNPIIRVRRYLDRLNLWNDEQEKQVRDQTRREVLALLSEMSKAPKVPLDQLVTDVYSDVPQHLQEQKQFVEAIAQKYPEYYNTSAH
jgi:2-oxoisovalerate dehydrogenase E1 component alpha subunit